MKATSRSSSVGVSSVFLQKYNMNSGRSVDYNGTSFLEKNMLEPYWSASFLPDSTDDII